MNKINERFYEIQNRKAEIRTAVETATAEELETFETELRSLDDESKTIEKRMKMADGIITVQKPEERGIDNMDNKNIGVESAEYRSAFLKKLQGVELNEMEQRTITSASNSVGAVIPTQTLNMIVDKLRQVSALFPHISVYNIPSNLSIPTVNTTNGASWVAETAASTDGDDTLGSVTLAAYKLIRTLEITAQVETMSIDAFETFIANEMVKQLSIAIENAILNGTGTNQPTGIIKGITWDATNTVTVAKTASLTYDNICDVLALLPSMYHTNAKVIVNRKTLYSSIAKIKNTADGLPIFINNTENGFAGKLLGFPVVIDDYIADNDILIGDVSYYVMNFSQNFEITSDRSAGFRTGTTVYRGMALVDGKVTQPEAFTKITKATV